MKMVKSRKRWKTNFWTIALIENVSTLFVGQNRLKNPNILSNWGIMGWWWWSPRAFCAFEIGFENVEGEDGLISFGSWAGSNSWFVAIRATLIFNAQVRVCAQRAWCLGRLAHFVHANRSFPSFSNVAGVSVRPQRAESVIGDLSPFVLTKTF